MRWIRLDAAFDKSEWLFVLSAESQLAWVKLLCYVKCEGVAGKAKAMSPLVAAKTWGIGEEAVHKLLQAAVSDGALESDGKLWTVVNWKRFQDPDNVTSAERSKRYRDNQKNVTVRHGSSRRDTGVAVRATETETETETERLVTTSDTSLGGVGGKQQRGTRLPKDWEPSDADLEFCRKQRPDLRAGDVAEGFRDYWHSKAGAQATKLDWSATWRNWVRGQKSNGKPKNPYSDLTQLNRDLKAYLEESN